MYKNSGKLLLVAVLILVLLVLNLLLGSVKIPAADVIGVLFGDRSNEIFSNIMNYVYKDNHNVVTIKKAIK